MRPSLFPESIHQASMTERMIWSFGNELGSSALEKIVADLTIPRSHADATDKRLLDLVRPLLTYVRSNRNAIVNYGARYRAGRRIASSLAKSAVDSLVARGMLKKQQMQWSLKGAHRMLQVRAAIFNGDLSERLAWQPPEPNHRHHWPGCSSPRRHCCELHETRLICRSLRPSADGGSS